MRTGRSPSLWGKQRILDPFRRSVEEPYWFKPSTFLRLAADQAPKEPIGTVSEFAGWVYSLCAPPQSKATLHHAKSVEAPIFDKRPELWLDSFMVEAPSTKWHPTHNGLHTGNITGFRHFEIPTLSVGGEPLRASPDLVYRHSETKSTVIVEIKFSRRPIPSNLWPNVWAQLWAYSKIPSLTESPTLSVVGEIWGGRTGGTLRRSVIGYTLERPSNRIQGALLLIVSSQRFSPYTAASKPLIKRGAR